MGGANCPNRRVPGICPNGRLGATGCGTIIADTSKVFECWYTMDFDPIAEPNCDTIFDPAGTGAKCGSRVRQKHDPGCTTHIACWWG